jgi:hypothetical protein
MSRRDYELQISWVETEKLVPYVNNNKQHPDEQIDKIATQIHHYGFDQPIVINKENIIIKGHGRYLAAKKLEIEKVPCVVREDLDEYEESGVRIADNAVARSDWDEDNLKFELGTLDRNGYDMTLTGLEDKEVAKFLDDEVKVTDEGGGEIDLEEKKQYIVSVDCESEDQMAELYSRLKDEGYNCSLIT